jgi:RHS repeat-associated protein
VVLRSSQVNDFQNRFELQGKERDLTFGLNWVNFGARRMNPTIGRMDNIDAMASKFASHSLYNYTLNNPLVIIDPDGNESRDIWGNTTFNGFVGDDGNGNFVGSTGGGGEDDKGKKKGEEKKKEGSARWDQGVVPVYSSYLDSKEAEAKGEYGKMLGYSFLTALEFVGLVYTFGESAVLTTGIRGVSNVAAKKGASSLPTQIHHFATNKHSVFTKQMSAIAQKYGLNLNGAWNKAAMPHLGRHPNEYHKFVLEGMERASLEAGSHQAKFLQLFDQYVKQPILQNPNLLRKSGW